MKKALPILIVLALIVAVGLGYFMGQRSNAPTAETPPAESSTPDATQTASPEQSTEPEIDLLSYFQRAYDSVWSKPENYNADYSQTDLELENLSFFIRSEGHDMYERYYDQYLNWRNETYPTNAYLLNFSGNYLNRVFAETMYAYPVPYITLSPVAEFNRFDEISGAQMSDDGTWFRVEQNGTFIYYRCEDLSGGLTEAEMDALWEQYMAQKNNPDTNIDDTENSNTTDYNAGLDGGDWSGDTLPDWAFTDPGYTNSDPEDFKDTTNSEHSTGEGTGAGLIIEG